VPGVAACYNGGMDITINSRVKDLVTGRYGYVRAHNNAYHEWLIELDGGVKIWRTNQNLTLI
jgi:hypothetical protein